MRLEDGSKAERVGGVFIRPGSVKMPGEGNACQRVVRPRIQRGGGNEGDVVVADARRIGDGELPRQP